MMNLHGGAIEATPLWQSIVVISVLLCAAFARDRTTLTGDPATDSAGSRRRPARELVADSGTKNVAVYRSQDAWLVERRTRTILPGIAVVVP
ncbi:hypothetical protein [Halorubellus salinus]|uniref:hypothetical protein n=1 Tax=Halorubellus salinus TaxID=755309 RepID=UPI001D0998BB|nr:hypothetical protein [Halorubellus salinus]